jgi:gas vesicle protein
LHSLSLYKINLSMKSGKAILGLIAGLAAGAVIGVLLAPDKGSETRKKFAKKGEDIADDLKQKFNDFIDNLANNNKEKEENPETAEGSSESSESKS